MSTFARGLGVAALLAGSAIAAAPALADETDPPGEFTVSGTVAVVTDYRFRGLSRSGGDAAVQGAIDLDHISGFHVGVWSSSLGFDDARQAAEDRYGSQELDIVGGWRGQVGGGLTADVGLLYYLFPNGRAGKADFFEPYAALSATLGPVMGKVGVKYAWKQEALNFDGGARDDNLYIHAGIEAGIPTTPISVAGHLGYTDGALSPRFATGETPTYGGGFDWSLGATWTVTRNLSLSGRYVGVQGRGIDGYSNDTLVGALRLSF